MAPKPQLSVQYEAGPAPTEDIPEQSLSYIRVVSKVKQNFFQMIIYDWLIRYVT